MVAFLLVTICSLSNNIADFLRVVHGCATCSELPSYNSTMCRREIYSVTARKLENIRKLEASNPINVTCSIPQKKVIL